MHVDDLWKKLEIGVNDYFSIRLNVALLCRRSDFLSKSFEAKTNRGLSAVYLCEDQVTEFETVTDG